MSAIRIYLVIFIYLVFSLICSAQRLNSKGQKMVSEIEVSQIVDQIKYINKYVFLYDDNDHLCSFDKFYGSYILEQKRWRAPMGLSLSYKYENGILKKMYLDGDNKQCEYVYDLDNDGKLIRTTEYTYLESGQVFKYVRDYSYVYDVNINDYILSKLEDSWYRKAPGSNVFEEYSSRGTNEFIYHDGLLIASYRVKRPKCIKGIKNDTNIGFCWLKEGTPVIELDDTEWVKTWTDYIPQRVETNPCVLDYQFDSKGNIVKIVEIYKKEDRIIFEVNIKYVE